MNKKYARIRKWLVDSGAMVGEEQYYDLIPLPYRYLDTDTDEEVEKENDETQFQIYFGGQWQEAYSSEWRVLDDLTESELQEYIEVTTQQVLSEQNRGRIKVAGSDLLQLLRKIGELIESKDFETVSKYWEQHGKELCSKLPNLENRELNDLTII